MDAKRITPSNLLDRFFISIMNKNKTLFTGMACLTLYSSCSYEKADKSLSVNNFLNHTECFSQLRSCWVPIELGGFTGSHINSNKLIAARATAAYVCCIPKLQSKTDWLQNPFTYIQTLKNRWRCYAPIWLRLGQIYLDKFIATPFTFVLHFKSL